MPVIRKHVVTLQKETTREDQETRDQETRDQGTRDQGTTFSQNNICASGTAGATCDRELQQVNTDALTTKFSTIGDTARRKKM